MTWFAVGATAVSVVSSAASGSAAASSARKQGAAAARADNEATIRANTQSMVRNSYKTGMMNIQLGLAKKKAVQEGHDTSVQANQVLGAVSANAAAAGTVGASVDAVASDVRMRWGEAEAQQRENVQQDLTNFNNELEALSISMEEGVQRERRYEYNGPSQGAILGNALLAGASTYMQVYGSRKMALGLGK